MPSVPGYELLDRIGSGGFSVVYRGTQVRLGRAVAVKVLFADLGAAADRRRFQRECEVLGSLGEYPHIVDVYDAGITDDGRPYIVMRLYSRGSLGMLVRSTGALPVDTVLDVGIKMAKALGVVHSLGVIHRDFKPDNILIDEDGEPVLSDFGVAARQDNSGAITTTSSAYSRPHASPEILDRNEFGVASDIYAWGSTMFTLLAGQNAFDAATDIRLAMAILNDPAPRLQRADAPAPMIDLIERCLAKDPSERPANSAELAEEWTWIQSQRSTAPALASLPVTSSTAGGGGFDRNRQAVPRGQAGRSPGS